MAVLVVCGLRMDGTRDILAVESMYEESEASYKHLFDSLKARGLKTVWLVASDAHKGLVASVKKSFVGASWQRCKVHFMRNIMAHIPAKDSYIRLVTSYLIEYSEDLSTSRSYVDSKLLEQILLERFKAA
jgi:putative transposase